MPIVSEASYRHAKTRALYGVIYLVLIAGAITMVYPFLLMLSGATKSAVDLKEQKVIPTFWYDDTMLYRKHVEAVFNESLDAMNIAYHDVVRSFEELQPPASSNPALVEVWHAFLRDTKLPPYACSLGHLWTPVSRTIPQYHRQFKSHVAKTYGRDIETVNRKFGTNFINWNAFAQQPENYLLRVNMPANTPLLKAFWDFKSRQPGGMLYYFSPEGFYRRIFLQNKYGKDIKKYNREHGTHYTSYADVHLSRRPPKGSAREREDWDVFLRNTLSLLWVRADAAAEPHYHRYLAAKYGTLDVLNRNYGTGYKSFQEIPLVDVPPFEGIVLSDWDAFIMGWQDPDTKIIHKLPADMLRVHSIDFQFRDYVRNKYKSIDAVNAALGTACKDFMSIIPPQRDAHYLAFLEMKRGLRWEFTTRNYKAVVEYVVLHGRGLVNTVIYCTLAVLAALIINPLAAYAMSRHKMASSYKILLFLMLTMAFPPMVTQIPAFLMLRDFHLLNTFAALVLPGIANGFSIFLLKGFFDALPRDLYDAAAVDGAGEWTTFWHITMSLSKPILSVIALGAFTAAYANFMFALLICQDEKMWTLMVWLYQLQQQSGRAVIYASLIIAAIPTFVVFVFCQKIILRGIVVPTEK